MKTLGLIGGMSAESTTIYYKTINEQVRARLGGHHSAKLILWSVDFAEIEQLQRAGAWDKAGVLLAEVAVTLQDAGAEAILICANTMHKVADSVRAALRVPLLHIGDAIGEALLGTGARTPLLLATKYTMEQEFLRGYVTAKYALPMLIPDEQSRQSIHTIIFDELVKGIVKPQSKADLINTIKAGQIQGADCVVLGCTELGMLVGPNDLNIPVLDTALLHASAAVEFALSG